MAINTKASGAIGGAAQGASMGMTFGPWGAAAGAVVGGVLGALGGGGEDAAKEAMNLQLYQSDLEYKQRKRSMELEGRLAAGQSKAAIGASNILYTGSAETFLNAQANLLSQDLAWEAQSQRLNQKMIKAGGEAQISGMQTAGMNSMLSSVAGAGMSMWGGPAASSGAKAGEVLPKSTGSFGSNGAFDGSF